MQSIHQLKECEGVSRRQVQSHYMPSGMFLNLHIPHCLANLTVTARTVKALFPSEGQGKDDDDDDDARTVSSRT